MRSLDIHNLELNVEITEGETNIMILGGSVKDSELIEDI